MKTIIFLSVYLILVIPIFSIHPQNEEWVKLTREELQAKLEEVANKKDRIDLLNLLSYKLSSYDHDEAKKNAEAALGESGAISYKEGIVDSLNNLGLVYLPMGNLGETMRNYEQAKFIANKIGYEVGNENANIGLSRYYQMQGQFDMGFTMALKSRYILEKLSSKGPWANMTLAGCYQSLGVIYFYDRNTYAKARNYLLKSLELREKVGEKNDIGIAYHAIGEISQYLEKYEDALDYFYVSLKIGESIGNTYIIANVYQGLGDVFSKWNYEVYIDETKRFILMNFAKALGYYEKSEKLSKVIGDKFQRASILRNKGICLKKMQKYDDAIAAFKEALELAREIENPHTITTIAQGLKTVYETLGNLNEARIYGQIVEENKDILYANSMVAISLMEERSTKLTYLKILLGTLCFLLLAISVFLESVRRANKKLQKQKEKVEKSLSDIELLNNIGKEIISNLTIDSIMDKVYENLNKIMDATSFGIGIYNSKSKTLDFWSKEQGVKLPPYSLYLKEEERMAIQCFTKQKLIKTRNYPEEYTEFSPIIPAPKEGRTYKSHIFLPLTLDKGKDGIKRIGVITVQSLRIEAYSDYHVMVFQNIANYASIALDNANALEKIEKQTDRLREALEKEKELCRLKDQFMYTLSHQYKTPLTNIDLSQQYLKKYRSEMSEEELNEELEVISGNVNRMQALISLLLNFGRSFNPSDHDLNKLLSDIVSESSLRDGATHQILFNSDGKVSEAFIDKELIKILVNNLITNSIKYSEKGSEIEVSLETIGDNAVIKVKDHGCGIPEDILKLKDKRFHRGSNAPRDTYGTGLGLSIVEHYTDMHGGTVEYDSRLNEGTIVTVTLPRRKVKHENKNY